MRRAMIAMCSLVLSLAGGLVWFEVWSRAYDPVTKLIQFTPLLPAIPAVMLLFALLLGRASGTPGKPSEDRPNPLADFGVVQTLFWVLGGLISLYASWQVLSYYHDRILLILSVLLLLQSVALLIYAISRKRTQNGHGSLLLLPLLNACFLMVALYHVCGSEPNQYAELWPFACGLLSAWCWLSYNSILWEPFKRSRFYRLVPAAILCLFPALISPLENAFRFALIASLCALFGAAFSPSTPTVAEEIRAEAEMRAWEGEGEDAPDEAEA